MNNEFVLRELKKVLKKKNYTYAHIAEEIGLSESGVKKLLNGKDISLKRLTQIAQVLSLSLADLFKLAEDQEIKSVQLTAKQEDTLLKNRALFRIYWLATVEGKKADEIKRIERISSEQLDRLLYKLENLDLIKLGKNKSIIPQHKGLIRWAENGPLVSQLNKDWSELTLTRALQSKSQAGFMHRLSYLKLTKSSHIDLLKKMDEVVSEFARKSQREKISNQENELVPVSTLIAITPVELI